MANTYNLIFSGAFLLVLIFSLGIISSEERLLKSTERNLKCGKRDSINNVNSPCYILEHAEYYEPTSVHKSSSVSEQNVFRPTTPGRSFGVGNTFEHAENYKPSPVGKSPNTVDDVSAEKVFRPLIPGHSPGPDVPIASGDSVDFRPTSPGHSSDVGNKSKHAEYYEPNPVKSPSIANVSAEKVFRPLIPGYVPYASKISGDSDDFRPTTPGHSPGAGHSAGPTNDGEN